MMNPPNPSCLPGCKYYVWPTTPVVNQPAPAAPVPKRLTEYDYDLLKWAADDLNDGGRALRASTVRLARLRLRHVEHLAHDRAVLASKLQGELFDRTQELGLARKHLDDVRKARDVTWRRLELLERENADLKKKLAQKPADIPPKAVPPEGYRLLGEHEDVLTGDLFRSDVDGMLLPVINSDTVTHLRKSGAFRTVHYYRKLETSWPRVFEWVDPNFPNSIGELAILDQKGNGRTVFSVNPGWPVGHCYRGQFEFSMNSSGWKHRPDFKPSDFP